MTKTECILAGTFLFTSLSLYILSENIEVHSYTVYVLRIIHKHKNNHSFKFESL